MHHFRRYFFYSILSISVINHYTQSAFAFNNHDNHKKPRTFSLILSRGCDYKYGYCWTSSSPVIANGIIFVGDYSGIVSAISQKSGRILWRYKTYDEHYVSTAAVNDNAVFVSTGSGICALDKNTGKLKLHHSSHLFGYPTNPVIQNDILFFGGRFYSYAVDERSGQEKWDLYIDGINFTSNIIHGDNLFAGSYIEYRQQAGFYSINKNTGELYWKFTAKDKTEEFYSTPCVTKGIVFVLGSHGNFYAIDEITGKQKWTYATGNGFYNSVSSPFCDSDTVFVGATLGNKGGALYAFDAMTGNIKWQFKTQSDVFASPTVSNGVVFFGDNNGHLYAVDKIMGNVKWQFAADNSINSRPVVDHGIIYFTTKGSTLYAIDEITGLL